MGLEELHGVDPALAQCHLVLGHRPVVDPVDLCRVETCMPQVALQADPGRRHLGHAGKPNRPEIGQAEARPWPCPYDEEGIAGHHVAEADQVGRRLGIAQHHDPERPAPHDVDLAGAQGPRSRGRIG